MHQLQHGDVVAKTARSVSPNSGSEKRVFSSPLIETAVPLKLNEVIPPGAWVPWKEPDVRERSDILRRKPPKIRRKERNRRPQPTIIDEEQYPPEQSPPRDEGKDVTVFRL